MSLHRTSTPVRRHSWRATLACSVCALVVGLVLGAWVGHMVVSSPTSQGSAPLPPVTTAPNAEGVTTPSGPPGATTPRPRPSGQVPAELTIPAIDVRTPLVRLGLMPDRTVEVPADALRAGWFVHGATPGQRGSAVILGHVDSVDGPAVFARLQELRRGNIVLVRARDGSLIRFVVRRSVSYANADFPSRRVYARQGGERLNLVTCTGVYDQARDGYQSNLVVYTRRVS